MQWQQHVQPHQAYNTIQHFYVPNIMRSLGYKPFGEREFYSLADELIKESRRSSSRYCSTDKTLRLQSLLSLRRD